MKTFKMKIGSTSINHKKVPVIMKKSGIELISNERKRQIEVEGWTAEHDAIHTKGQLAIAAACYALTELSNRNSGSSCEIVFWPWARKYWKPTPKNRIKELTKAGALIAAEIDRLKNIDD